MYGVSLNPCADPWWILELDANEDHNVDFTDDNIVGTDGDDEIDSGGGDDLVIAGDGDDLVHGDSGDNQLRGEAGNDWLYCGAGDDALYNEKGCHTFPYQPPLRNSIMLQ